MTICNQCGKQYKTGGNTTNLMDHLKRMHPTLLKDQPLEKAKCMTKFLKRDILYSNTSEKKKRIDKLVLNMVASDVLPLNVVNNVGLTKLIHELDPRYKMPSKTHLRNVLLKNEYNSIKETLKAELQIVESVALTTDGWSSRANESYLTVTCHFVTESFELASKILSTNQLITPTKSL